MDARATARARFEIEWETASALEVVVVSLLFAVVVRGWMTSKSPEQQLEAKAHS